MPSTRGVCWSDCEESYEHDRTGLVQVKLQRQPGDSCVEVALAEQAVHVRDSKDITRPDFTVGPESWTRFVRYAAGI
ncbi:protein of unknown function [Streptomyces murinus]